MSVRVFIPLDILDDLLSGIVSRVRPKEGGPYVREARITENGMLELAWVEKESK